MQHSKISLDCLRIESISQTGEEKGGGNRRKGGERGKMKEGERGY